MPKGAKLVLWSWDTAHKKGQANDPTAVLVVAETKNAFYLVDCVCRKMEFPELKKEVKMRYGSKRASWVLVEDKASGQDLIPELKADTTMPVKAVKVDKDKVARVNYVIGGLEAGNWYLPEGAGWVADFVDECAAFPNGDHDDRVDAWSQAATFLKDRKGGPMITVHEWGDEVED